MKTIYVLFGLVLSIAAQASPQTPVAGLISRLGRAMQERRSVAADPLLQISGAPAVQGSEYNLFIRPVTDYAGAYVVLDATLDGTPISLEHPTQDLWIFNSPQFEKIASHTIAFSVSLENSTQADQISQALSQLQAQIQALQTQIANTTDANQLAQLHATLNEKLALQSQLTAELVSLKNAIGTQSYTFTVAPAPSSSTSFPRITAVSPNVGATSGGTAITLTGANFASGAGVTVGGIAATNVSVVSATTITAVTPAFPADGAKDVVVTLPQGSGDVEPKSALLGNAFFATSAALGGLSFPVAITGSPQAITLGAAATLSGSQSVGPAGHTLSYAWTLISKPAGSNLATGSPFSTAAAPSVTPDYPGKYVYQLVVTDTATNAASAPSLTVLTVSLASSTLTASAANLTLIRGGYGESQITVQDANAPYLTYNYYITLGAVAGLATVSPSGLFAYQENSTTATFDSVGVTVVSNGNPQTSYTFFIDETITPYTAPTATGVACSIQSNTLPIKAGCSPQSPAAPGGTMASYMWFFGDSAPAQYQFSPAASTGNAHDYYDYGKYFLGVALSDNHGSTTWLSAALSIVPELIPINNFKLSSVSGAAPFTVTADATASQARQGSLTTYRWIWGDGVSEQGSGPSFATRSHTYTTTGTFPVSLWLFDGQGGNTQLSTNVYVGVTPPATGAPASPYINLTTPREQVVGTPFVFDGATYSNDPNPSGAITGYSWNFADSQCSGNCTDTTATPSHTYSVARNSFVTLQVKNAAGGLSGTQTLEIFNVNRGHAPRSRFSAGSTSGVAPFTVSFNGTQSWDYDGTIASYVWTWGDGSPTSTGTNPSHTYLTPGTYFTSLAVTDNDGNVNSTSLMITARSSALLSPLQVDGGSDQNADLVNACGMDNAVACDALAQIYAQNGDTFTSGNLRARACSLGYTDDCGGR